MAQDRGMPIEVTPTRTAFVYDTLTGKVVHIHQFVPARPGRTIPDDEMEKVAIELAPLAFDRARLRVVHADERQSELSPESNYRVDLKSRALVVERAERFHPGERPERPKRG